MKMLRGMSETVRQMIDDSIAWPRTQAGSYTYSFGATALEAVGDFSTADVEADESRACICGELECCTCYRRPEYPVIKIHHSSCSATFVLEYDSSPFGTPHS